MQALILVYAVACIFGAAVVRGYSGFGFSLLAIISLSLLLPPTEIVPSIFIMDVAASMHLLPGVWRDIHWRPLLWLAVGCLVGTPFGVYALAHVPPAPMTLALAVFVLIAAILLARGYALKSLPGPAATFATGTASGLFNGSFGIGGPPVILFFFSSPAGAAAGRLPDDRRYWTCMPGLERTAQPGDALARPAVSAGVDCRYLAGQSRFQERGLGGLSTLGLAPLNAVGGADRRKGIDANPLTAVISIRIIPAVPADHAWRSSMPGWGRIDYALTIYPASQGNKPHANRSCPAFVR